MKASIVVAVSIVAGMVVTLATGLFNSTPANLVGATWYGWPIAWLYVIVYPGSPWFVDWVNFAGDLTLWFVVALAVSVPLSRKRKQNQTQLLNFHDRS